MTIVVMHSNSWQEKFATDGIQDFLWQEIGSNDSQQDKTKSSELKPVIQ